MNIACIDVGYIKSESDPMTAIASCAVINDRGDAESLSELVANVDAVQDHQPGQFYLRELPCIKAVPSEFPSPPTHIVIDGYIWLDDQTASAREAGPACFQRAASGGCGNG